jgi:hypothetical protein
LQSSQLNCNTVEEFNQVEGEEVEYFERVSKQSKHKPTNQKQDNQPIRGQQCTKSGKKQQHSSNIKRDMTGPVM